jgi:hypothetical protein
LKGEHTPCHKEIAMEKSMFELAIEDLKAFRDRWRYDRKSFPQQYWVGNNRSLWNIFTMDEILAIYEHYRAKGINLMSESFSGLQCYLRKHREKLLEFRQRAPIKKYVYHRNRSLDEIKECLRNKKFSCLKHVTQEKTNLRTKGIWDAEIEEIIEEKRAKFKKRGLNNEDLPLYGKLSGIALQSFVEARKRDKDSIEYLLKDAIERRKSHITARVLERLHKEFGYDEASQLRRILTRALQKKINEYDFCAISDDVFITLLDFLELRSYEKCLEILPALALYLSSDRSGGTKKDVYFPVSNRLEKAG